MAYEKPFLSVSDHAVGLQCVNRALENNRALFEDQFDPGHSAGLGGTAQSDPFFSPGRHDDPLVARTVANFSVSTVVDEALAIVTGPFLFGAPEKLDIGQWLIDINAAVVTKCYAVPLKATNGNPHAATCRIGTGDGGSSAVYVSTWDIIAGAPADIDFALVIFSEGVV